MSLERNNLNDGFILTYLAYYKQ